MPRQKTTAANSPEASEMLFIDLISLDPETDINYDEELQKESYSFLVKKDTQKNRNFWSIEIHSLDKPPPNHLMDTPKYYLQNLFHCL
jgi:hypothetical protein